MIRRTLLVLACSVLATAQATAFSLDFVAAASGNEGSGIPSFFFPNVDGSGVDLTVTARDLSDAVGGTEATDPYPYLDDLLSGRPGGLGVCQIANCSGNADDNLGWAGVGEVLILEFSAPVLLQSLTLNNGDHFQAFVGDVGIHVGNSNPTSAASFNNILAATPVLAANLPGTRFSFVSEESFQMASGPVEEQIYIGSISFIPEPSTALLVSLGLLGISARQRRCR